VITSPAPVAADSQEESFFSFPEMGTAGDIREQGFGMGTLFQTHQRRKSLAVDRQMTKGASVGFGICRKEHGFRHERFRLGERLTGVKAQLFGFRTACKYRGTLILAGKEHDVRPFKLGPRAANSLDRPLRKPDAQDPRHGRSPTPGCYLPFRPGGKEPRYATALFLPGLRRAA
jgi:hypothetical protein